jgi:hypothetical protein
LAYSTVSSCAPRHCQLTPANAIISNSNTSIAGLIIAPFAPLLIDSVAPGLCTGEFAHGSDFGQIFTEN